VGLERPFSPPVVDEPEHAVRLVAPTQYELTGHTAGTKLDGSPIKLGRRWTDLCTRPQFRCCHTCPVDSYQPDTKRTREQSTNQQRAHAEP
jgi:hypothetical protein